MRDIKDIKKELEDTKDLLSKIDPADYFHETIYSERIDRLEKELAKALRGEPKVKTVTEVPTGRYQYNRYKGRTKIKENKANLF